MNSEYLKDLTLLYVEDDDAIRESLSRRLEKFSKKLYVAQDGEEGYKKYLEHKPDIVLTDVTMPKMNGIEMSQMIKQNNPAVPIIVVSAHGEAKYLLDAIECGISNYLLKPIQKVKLFTMLESEAKKVCLERINEKQQNQIKEQKIILQNILDAQKSITFVTDYKSISFVNKEFLNFFNLNDIEAFQTKYETFLDVFEIHTDYIDKGLLSSDGVDDNITQGKSFYNIVENIDETKRVVLLLNKNLEPKAYYINISILEEEKHLYLITLTDITKMAVEKKNTEKKAYIDHLTGVKNRNRFVECFNEEITRVNRYKHDLSIAILDIDHFKSFNDTHGHLIGDEVLKMIAKNIDSSIRTNDIFARWGGEEFVLLFPETSLVDAVITSNMLRKKIEELNHTTAGKVTASFGVCEYHENDTIESLFKRCDDLLYKAKENGRNRVECI